MYYVLFLLDPALPFADFSKSFMKSPTCLFGFATISSIDPVSKQGR